MAEKKLPGQVFLVVGAAVMLMSVFLGIRSGMLEKFALFIFVGAVFIVIGFFKILLKEKRSAEHMHAHHAAQQHHAQHHAHAAAHPQHHPAHAQHPQHQQHAQPSQVVRCSGCGVKLHPLFKFCPNCGQKMG